MVLDRELRYIVWNRAMEELSGLSAGQVLGRPASAVFPHLRATGHEALLARALAGEVVHIQDVAYRHPRTGQVCWYTGAYWPHRDPAGAIRGRCVSLPTCERERWKLLAYTPPIRHGPSNRGCSWTAGAAFGAPGDAGPLRRAPADLDRVTAVNDRFRHAAGDAHPRGSAPLHDACAERTWPAGARRVRLLLLADLAA